MWNNIINCLKEYLGENLLSVILFGSHAYKGYGRDIDLIVILKQDISFEKSIDIKMKLLKILNYKSIPDIIFFTLEDFLDNLKPGIFLSGLALGYKILYDKILIDKYIKKFMEELSKEYYAIVKNGERYLLNKFAMIRR